VTRLRGMTWLKTKRQGKGIDDRALLFVETGNKRYADPSLVNFPNDMASSLQKVTRLRGMTCLKSKRQRKGSDDNGCQGDDQETGQSADFA
jgi:hypothetical protein